MPVYENRVENASTGQFEAYTGINSDIDLLLKDTFGEDWQTFKEIAIHESNLNPYAYNNEWHKNCQGSYGLFQIGCVNYRGDPKDLFDLELNIKKAKEVYDSQGFRAWKNVCAKIKCEV